MQRTVTRGVVPAGRISRLPFNQPTLETGQPSVNKFSLSKPWMHVEGAEVWLHSFLTSILSRGEIICSGGWRGGGIGVACGPGLLPVRSIRVLNFLVAVRSCRFQQTAALSRCVWSCCYVWWRLHMCRLSATAYSIYSQQPSILEAVPPTARWGRAMPWWQGLHNEELNDLHCSLNIVRVIKSRRMRWAGHVARMGEERCIQDFGGKPEGK
jgi:hypothetical protein